MKAVVFDMDGVLFDTERVCMESWVTVAERHGMQGMREVFPLCIGRNMADDERIIKEHYGEDFDYAGYRKETSKEFWEIIEKNGLPQKKGVKELLSFLAADGWRIGLASSTKRASILSLLESAGIREYFSYIIGGEEIEHSKPEPEIYLKACEGLGAKPEETIAIEDSYNGIRSASRAGMIPVMVPDMLPPTPEMEQLSCVILSDLLEVLTWIKEREDKSIG
ncbi:MAG: HAD family phosphatase [Lachnospiraceae bacterium]|nr:HAD family phosphatase [Lachnospiraceae bacterium]